VCLYRLTLYLSKTVKKKQQAVQTVSHLGPDFQKLVIRFFENRAAVQQKQTVKQQGATYHAFL